MLWQIIKVNLSTDKIHLITNGWKIQKSRSTSTTSERGKRPREGVNKLCRKGDDERSEKWLVHERGMENLCVESAICNELDPHFHSLNIFLQLFLLHTGILLTAHYHRVVLLTTFRLLLRSTRSLKIISEKISLTFSHHFHENDQLNVLICESWEILKFSTQTGWENSSNLRNEEIEAAKGTQQRRRNRNSKHANEIKK